MSVRSRVPVILAGAFASLGALSLVPVFAGDSPLGGVFAVLLGSPWVQLLSSLLGSGGAAAVIALASAGIAANAAILYFTSRWLVRRGSSR
jgi:hypothetical protein